MNWLRMRSQFSFYAILFLTKEKIASPSMIRPNKNKGVLNTQRTSKDLKNTANNIKHIPIQKSKIGFFNKLNKFMKFNFSLMKSSN